MGIAESAIDCAGLNAPTYWNGIIVELSMPSIPQ
jgi:hypothetical protein